MFIVGASLPVSYRRRSACWKSMGLLDTEFTGRLGYPGLGPESAGLCYT